MLSPLLPAKKRIWFLWVITIATPHKSNKVCISFIRNIMCISCRDIYYLNLFPLRLQLILRLHRQYKPNSLLHLGHLHRLVSYWLYYYKMSQSPNYNLGGTIFQKHLDNGKYTLLRLFRSHTE